MNIVKRLSVFLLATAFSGLVSAGCLKWAGHVEDGDFLIKNLEDGTEVKVIDGGMHTGNAYTGFIGSYPAGHWTVETRASLNDLRLSTRGEISGTTIVQVPMRNGVVVRQFPTEAFADRGSFNSASSVVDGKRYPGLKTQFPADFPNSKTSEGNQFLSNFEDHFNKAAYPLAENQAMRVNGQEFTFVPKGKKGGAGTWFGAVAYTRATGEQNLVNVEVRVVKFGGDTAGGQNWDVGTVFPTPQQP